MPAFLTFILKNLWRRRARTLLTSIGIGIGIATVVTLGVLADSTKSASEQIFHIGGADALVAQRGSTDLSFSVVTEDDLDAVRADKAVASAMGVSLFVVRAGSLSYFVLFGVDPDELAAHPPQHTVGRQLDSSTARELLLGSTARRELETAVGDEVDLNGSPWKIVGGFTDQSAMLNGGAYAPIDSVRDLAGRPDDSYTFVLVRIRDGESVDDFQRRFEDDHPTLSVVSSLEDFGKVDQGIDMVEAVNFALSLVAVLIGAIGVMNTMVMSVFERTHEIGVVRALGWSRARVLRMVLGEALVLCVLGAMLGSAMGVAAALSFRLNATFRALLDLEFTWQVFARGAGVAVVVALLGAAYPAWRATRLMPTEALRHE